MILQKPWALPNVIQIALDTHALGQVPTKTKVCMVSTPTLKLFHCWNRIESFRLREEAGQNIV